MKWDKNEDTRDVKKGNDETEQQEFVFCEMSMQLLKWNVNIPVQMVTFPKICHSQFRLFMHLSSHVHATVNTVKPWTFKNAVFLQLKKKWLCLCNFKAIVAQRREPNDRFVKWSPDSYYLKTAVKEMEKRWVRHKTPFTHSDTTRRTGVAPFIS